MELDEFLGTPDVQEGNVSRTRTDADISADAERTRYAMRNMLYNIEHGGRRNFPTHDSTPLRKADSAAVDSGINVGGFSNSTVRR